MTKVLYTKKFYLSRHLSFILAEFIALWKEEYLCDSRLFKKTKRYWMRVVANYAESLHYYLFKKSITASIAPLDFTVSSSPSEAVERLRKQGIAKLPDVDVDALTFVTITPSNSRPQEAHQVDQEAALKFAQDRGLHEIAARYLEEKECYYLSRAWRLNRSPEEKLAVGNAKWHRDRDGFKVLKFFVYLSDVFDDDGEHEYALGTHKIKEIHFVPQTRFSNAEVENRYKTIKIKGSRGTCFVEDTTGLHKASIPINSNRDILSFIYFSGPVFWETATRKINLKFDTRHETRT